MAIRHRRVALIAVAATAAVGATLLTVVSAHAAPACRVTYQVTSQWPGGFGANVTIHNIGDPVNGWSLTWAFPAGQTVVQAWNAQVPTGTSQINARNVSYNAAIPTGGNVAFGFNGAWTGSNPAPTSFTLNGTVCNGGTPTTTAPTTPTTAPPTTPATTPPTTPPATTPPTTPPTSNPGCTVQPINPNATAAARRLLCYVYSTYGNAILSGQQESTWIGGPEYEMNHIQSTTGKLPAIRGLDMGDSPTFGARAAAWWNAGGIPMVGYHMGSPSQDQDNYAGSRMRGNINAALTSGTADNRRLLQRLDAVAAQLQQTRTGAVIFRPYHEAGGTWFWWSMEGGNQYNRLWRFTYEYLTNTKGLNHLVWLHGYNGAPDSAFYPGRQYVDIGGADTYRPNGDYQPLTQMYNQCRSIYGTTMPIALHENGPIPDPDQLRSAGARWVLFGTWHGQHLTVSNPAAHLRKVYTHSYVITRDELPNLR